MGTSVPIKYKDTPPRMKMNFDVPLLTFFVRRKKFQIFAPYFFADRLKMRPKILKLSGRVVMIHPYFSNSIFFQQKCGKFIKTPLQICQKAETYPGFGTPPKRRFFGIKWGQLSPLLIWAPPPYFFSFSVTLKLEVIKCLKLVNHFFGELGSSNFNSDQFSM